MRPATQVPFAASPPDGAERAHLHEAMTGAVARASSFIEGAQVANGRWLDFRSERLISSHWVTAYVGSQLAGAGAGAAAVARACAYLLGNRHPAGGWGYNRANPPDADSIANVIHLLVRCPESAQVAAAIDEAVALLSRYRAEPAGGYRTYHVIAGDPLRSAGSSWCDAHPSVTAMCAMALAAVDERAHEPVIDTCASFLRSAQRPDGLWDAFWWDGITYATYQAARLLAHIGDTDRVALAAQGLVRVRRGDGGWGNGAGSESAPFHTALAVSALLLDRGGAHAGAVQDGLAWLVRAQQPDGGWPAVPILRVPRPEVHQPWRHPDGDMVPLTADRNRLFTTATVLSALVDGHGALAPYGAMPRA